MRSASIWAVALAATMTFACGDNDQTNNTATDADRTATAASPAATAGGDQAASRDASANRDIGANAPMARAANADNEREFVDKMAQVGVAEVKLGQLAAERASNPQAKQFARRMVTDHQKANAELKQVAAKMSVQVPEQMDAKHQELYDRLSKLKGAEFDREYMNAMVDGHQEVAAELERHADSNRAGDRSVGTSGDVSQTASVNAWASKTLPDVKQHLEQA
jgi:putative membrane protein